MPHYISIGLDHKLILHSTPKLLHCYDKGYDLRRKIIDEISWLQGRYDLEAFQVVMAHFGAGLSNKSSNAEYMSNPLFSKLDNDSPKYAESNEEIAVYEMKQRVNILQKTGLPESPS